MMWKVLKKMGGQACWVPGEVLCTGHRLLLLHVVLLERDIQHPQQEDLQLFPLPIASVLYFPLCFGTLSVGDPSFCGRHVLPRELDCRSPKACALYFVGPKISESIVRDPEYNELFRLMSACGHLLNDVQSYEREGSQGKLNSVSLLALHGGCSMSIEEAKGGTKAHRHLQERLAKIGS